MWRDRDGGKGRREGKRSHKVLCKFWGPILLYMFIMIHSQWGKQAILFSLFFQAQRIECFLYLNLEMNASQLHAVNPFPGKYMAISRRKAFILLNEFTSSLQHRNQWVAQQRLKRQCFSEQEPYYLCLPVSTNKTFQYMSDIRIWKF